TTAAYPPGLQKNGRSALSNLFLTFNECRFRRNTPTAGCLSFVIIHCDPDQKKSILSLPPQTSPKLLKTMKTCWNSIQPFRRLSVLAFGIVLACAQGALGTDIATHKLTAHWKNSTAGYELGYVSYASGVGPNTLASNDNWIVVGAPLSSDQDVGSGGGAQVFNAVTGAWVRKLLPPLPVAASTLFGNSCAINGSTAVIGAPGPTASSPGAAYVYNLTTGALLKTLKPNPGDGANGDFFGTSVAITDTRVVVGAYADDSNKGSIYVFDLKTGAQIIKLQDPLGVSNDAFGFSMASEGSIVIVGAPRVDSYRGAGYAYDISANPPAFIKKYQPSTSVANDQAGFSVAIHQGKIILGAAYAGASNSTGKIFVMGLQDTNESALTGSDVGQGEYLGRCVATHQGLLIAGSPFQAGGRGAVYVFDLNSTSTTEFQKLLPPDGGTSYFGLNVALCGNQAVMAAPFDKTPVANAGSLYVMSPLMRPMPLTKVAAKGDFAPGANESNFGTIGDAYLNNDGETTFTSTTTGPGSNASKDVGIWNTLALNQPLDLVLKTRQIDGGLTIAAVSAPLANYNSNSILRATLSGAGVTSINNQAIYKDDGTTVSRVLRTGDANAAFTGAVPSGFTQVVQSDNTNRFATTCTLRQNVATTTAANDSGVLWYDVGTSTMEAQREGSVEPVSGLTYGQFTGRVAGLWTNLLYSAAIAPPTVAAFNQALFSKGFGNAVFKAAQKGDLAPGAAGAAYSSFLGETVDDGNRLLYRATLGAPATTANNEGLWNCYQNPLPSVYNLAMRKGDPVPGLPGVKIAKFIQFWQSFTATFALVQLSGTGVTAANDQALLIWKSSSPLPNQMIVLLREGDLAPGCGAARIGTISRVQLENYNAHYYVLATLTGAPIGTELALFRGYGRRTTPNLGEVPLLRPSPVLRKGQLFANQPGKITSISLPSTNITASGAGSTGLGFIAQISSSGNTPSQIVIAVDFANGVHQVMKGIP
ncbi:MAG: hypothetical protein JWO94_787, partial [Verrucomicrobiaceae bacterium]|nr:hypothetical protein [Verrucomicrobiaceae bacterium]